MNAVDVAALLVLLDQHVAFLSEANEAEINAGEWDMDIADYALRTCSCGERLDGFDGYQAHLREEVLVALSVPT